MSLLSGFIVGKTGRGVEWTRELISSVCIVNTADGKKLTELWVFNIKTIIANKERTLLWQT